MTQAGPTSARAALVTLRSRIDTHFDAATRAQPNAFACAPGCSRCCHARFGVFELEAESIRQALAALAHEDPPLRERVREQAQPLPDAPSAQHCALLVDDRCTVYEARPLICRSHGLAVKVQPEAAADHCPLNFTDEAPAAPGVLALDRVNAALVVAAALFEGPGKASGKRVDLATLAGESG